MNTDRNGLLDQGRSALEASKALAILSSDQKNLALQNLASALVEFRREILDANAKDLKESESRGAPNTLLDRLLLTPQRLEDIARDVNNIVALPDPVGEVFDMQTRPNGLLVGKKRVPLGVIGAIYESRPNVTIEISALCLKSGNACLLRGGSEAIHSNRVLADYVRQAIGEAGVTENAVQLIQDTDRSLVESMLQMDSYIDLIIPRGGADLIRMVGQKATMPVVTGGVGVCHTYVDKSADLDKAIAIAVNAKVQRPTVCNALDTLLVHSQIASSFLPDIVAKWSEAGVEIRCDRRAVSALGPTQDAKVVIATSKDWGKEFLSLVAAVKVVDSLEDALEHIEAYGSGHSEAIVTEDYGAAMRFLEEVDAAAVYVNASTYFTDGAQFGLGAEVGISTQKFHARGPMGLKELTSYKWIIFGSGQIRV